MPTTDNDAPSSVLAPPKLQARDWIVLPNPSYGSFEAVPYGFNYQASPEEMRADKRKALTSWDGQ